MWCGSNQSRSDVFHPEMKTRKLISTIQNFFFVFGLKYFLFRILKNS